MILFRALDNADAVIPFHVCDFDFGATLMVAGDTPGITRTMPLAVYAALQEGDTHTATTFALLSAAICLTVCTLAAKLGQK